MKSSNKKINDSTEALVNNLSRNVKLDHIDYVDHGVREVDADYYTYRQEFLSKWGGDKYKRESLRREQQVEQLYGTNWKSKRIEHDVEVEPIEKVLHENESYAKRCLNAVKQNPYGYAALLFIIVIVGCWIYKSNFGPKAPGSFLERTNYENAIYVLVYPDKDKEKHYYLPGDVTKSGDSYTISEIKWPNGGYSTFDDCQITIKEKSNCTVTNSDKFEKLVDKDGDPTIKELLSLPSYHIQLTKNLVPLR